MKKNKFAILLVQVLTLSFASGCGGGGATEITLQGGKKYKLAVAGGTKVEIKIKDIGAIQLVLDKTHAPISAENFISLAKSGFYDGLTFHRVIPNFMIQGGDPEGTGMGGSDTNIKGEFASNGVDNPISHVRGIISMARSQDPNSASSQFFITNADSAFLDGEYAAFGVVVSGMDAVDKVSAVQTGENDMPAAPVVIESIKVIN